MSGEKLKSFLAKGKEQLAKMSKRTRILAGIAGGGILLVAIVLTLILNNKNAGYSVLYPNMSATESGSVYQTLLEVGAEPKINDKGEVMVPSNEYDLWILQLAAKGYPQTALSYDVFSSHTGLTATESEKKQWLVYQLQDRLQETLKRISGVKNATVTITVPDNSDSVWETAESKILPTASVLLARNSATKLDGEQVLAIKNLVASSVPQMTAENVTVVDSETALELQDEAHSEGVTNTENLEYEQLVQRQIEDNIVRVLSPRYGADGVVAVAKVTLDYDKMMTERMELVKPENSEGYLKEDQGRYSINGETAASGVVGEENNTDIPQYGYNDPTAEDGMTYYWWDKNYDYGYIKTQVEKGNALLKRATVSVMVKDDLLTQAAKDELVSLVSRSVDIAPESIVVSSFTPPAEEAIPASSEGGLLQSVPLPVLIAVPIGLVLLIVAGVVILVIRKRKRKAEPVVAETDEAIDTNIQAEIDEYKKHLESLAKEGLDLKDDAVMKDVREFAKDNPEVTANLLRSWLKEGE